MTAQALRTDHELGFVEIQRALFARAQTPRGQERALLVAALANESAVSLALRRVEQARAVLGRGESVPVAGADDVRAHVTRAGKGAVLTGEELVACRRLMRAAILVRQFGRAVRDELPDLAHLAERVADFAPLAARLDYALEPSGTIRDSASDALLGLRKRARSLHAQIRTRIDELVREPTFAGYLQDSYYSVRNDRYVLPIKASYRSFVPGIVHNASHTGLTLFIEPQVMVELGNELSISESLATEEERRILAELSESVADRATPLHEAVEVLAELDVVQAAARLADDLEAAPARLAPSVAGFALIALRHPLLVLQKKQVVPSDVRLGDDECCLVVSGPNAGGKTVSITAVGLCALMTRAGLPIPAAPGSVMPLYCGVWSTIGDAQDLSRDLSTFSAHLGSLRDTLAVAAPGWLVLIDEIAADTDPSEGAALARAILEELVARGARTLVTTHLDEVKALGLTDRRFVNARVGLDAATLAPTYRLELGAAGGSSALEMATRVGLPEVIVARAREYQKGGGLLATALANLEGVERATQALREGLRAEREAAVQQRAAAAELARELVEQKRRVEALVRDELAAFMHARHDEVAGLIAELQHKPSIAAAQQAQKRLHELAAEDARARAVLDAGAETGRASPNGGERAGKIVVGTRVRVATLGKDGRVLSVEGKSALVEVGALHTRARLQDLVALPGGRGGGGGGGTGKSSAPGKARPPAAVGARPVSEPDARCDVRGLRADEAMSVIERFLDRCYQDGPNDIVLVHGHGTGALKQLVREALEKSPYVERFRPGDRHEGGDGATVVRVRS